MLKKYQEITFKTNIINNEDTLNIEKINYIILIGWNYENFEIFTLTSNTNFKASRKGKKINH
jgi:hypothetical protein